jgi:4-amino-4-deoxy-L-arabinose transferase-like glycosyltransferase
LLLLHAGLLAWAATLHSPTVDEPPHLAAGIAVWHLGRHELYQVNPPLVRTLAALPVVCAGPATDWSGFYQGPRPEAGVGWGFLRANPERWSWYFILARWACVPLSLLGGTICWLWASELYGPRAGLLALALWCFCPNILAHAQMITPDAGAAALGVTAAYCFWRWLKGPTSGRTWLAGVTLGLAELAKMTWVLLFLLWPLLWVVYRALQRSGEQQRSWLAQAGQLVLLLLLGLFVLNLGYGFDGSLQRLDSYRFSSRTLTGQQKDVSTGAGRETGNRFAGSWLGAVPVPVPRNYLLGMDLQKVDFEQQRLEYLHGKWQSPGWWYYYLYGLAVKVPLGTWLLVLLALVFKLGRAGPAVLVRDELIVLAPLVAVLVLVSSQTGMNTHFRYVLPAFPFGFVWASQSAQVRTASWKVRALVAGAAAWSIGSSLGVYPHSLSYFNELAGGPTNGHAHLVDSNIDWGQDLFYLKRWLEEHPEARPIHVACLTSVPLSFVDPQWQNFPDEPAALASDRRGAGKAGPQPGWFAVSVTYLRGADRRYAYFLQLGPVAMAGYSIYVYHLSLEDANGVRRELGQPELPGP